MTEIYFDRTKGQIAVNFQDPGANTSLASGMAQSSIVDNRNFSLTKPHTQPHAALHKLEDRLAGEHE